MSDDGFVLSDTLAALAILGLTMSGVVIGGTLLARIQARTDLEMSRVMGLKRASMALNDLLGQAGPFRSRDAAFNGGPLAFDFECGAARCGARLVTDQENAVLTVTGASGQPETITLTGVGETRFSYASFTGSGQTWPRASVKPDRLHQVALLQVPAQAPLAQATLSKDQPMTCEFDVISQECR